MKIWVDADALPRELRDIILRAAQRLKIDARFVANKNLDLGRGAQATLVRVAKGSGRGEHEVKELLHKFATMRGMMTEHGVSADDYLAYVHRIDHSPLEPNPAMGAAIARLPGRKLILTNGSTDHVDAVLARLGLAGHFDAVFDIIAAEFEPKPAPQTYQRFLELHGVDPTRSAMFEDLARNLVVPHQLGMTTVLVVPDGVKEVVREDWELEGRDAGHVDHVTDDLTGFLAAIRVPN